MQNILLLAPAPSFFHPNDEGPVGLIGEALRDARFTTEQLTWDMLGGGSIPELAHQLEKAFAGRPPDVLVADVSSAPDMTPLKHLNRLLQQIWGNSDAVPLTLVLLDPVHLTKRDWLALVDDFLLPPFWPAEARARLETLLYRKRSIDHGQIVFGSLRINLDIGNAQNENGDDLPLTPREFELLVFLLTHRGKLFSRERLVSQVWGLDFTGGERTVDIHIRRIRTKIPEDVAALLETRRGIGYGFRHSNT
jgi:two-component system, OmpR family, alkaline phosphatase synthesis response regulator PhoP